MKMILDAKSFFSRSQTAVKLMVRETHPTRATALNALLTLTLMTTSTLKRHLWYLINHLPFASFID
jgi:hypothetical protein